MITYIVFICMYLLVGYSTFISHKYLIKKHKITVYGNEIDLSWRCLLAFLIIWPAGLIDKLDDIEKIEKDVK